MLSTIGCRRLRARLVLAKAALVIALLAPMIAAVATHAQADGYPLTVLVVACDIDPGFVDPVAPPPGGCWAIGGGSITAKRYEGSRVDGCATSADGRCVLALPADERVLVAEATTTIPGGYRALRNPQSSGRNDEPGGLVFVNVPDPVADGETANITIHYRLCPEGYAGDDLFGDCHPNPGAFTGFWLNGPWPSERATGADGNVTFPDLPPGDYVVTGGTPSDFATYSFFCSQSSAPGVPIPWDQIGVGSYAELGLSLSAGDDVICDWYVIPSDPGAANDPNAPVRTTTIILFAWTCPRGYPEQTDFAVCRKDPRRGVNFRLSTPNPGDTWRTVQTSGSAAAAIAVTYRALPYRIVPDLESAIGWYDVVCTGEDDREIAVTYPRVGIAIDDLRDGEEIACDWYFIPAPLADGEPRG